MAALINFALGFFPVLLLIILLIVFCILGGKRGPVRALISVGATCLSAVAAYFIAKLLSGIGFSSAERALKGSALLAEETAPIMEKFNLSGGITRVLKGLSEALMKPIFFVPALIFAAVVIKLTVSAVCRKMKKPETKGQRFGGVLISAADAVLFVMLLNLPLFGLLHLIGGAAKPIVQSAAEVRMIPEDAVKYTESFAESGIVRLYANPVCEKAYALLTSFRYDGKLNSLSELTTDSAELASRCITLSEDGSRSAIAGALEEGKTLSEKHPFLADLTCDVLAELPADEDNPFLEPLRRFAVSVKKAGNQQENVSAVLSVASKLLGSETELTDVRALSEDKELIGNVIKDINSTEELSELKNDLLTAVIERVAGESGLESLDRLTEDLRALDENEAEKEADSFCMILSAAASMAEGDGEISADAAADLIEGLARHPLIGPEKTVDVITDLIRSQGGTLEIVANSSAMNGVRDALENAASSEDAGGFRSYLGSIANAAEAMSAIGDEESGGEAMAKLLGSDPAVLRTLKDSVTPDLLSAVGVPEELSTKLGRLFEVLFDEMAAAAERGTDTEKEAKAIMEVMSALVNADASEAKNLTDVITDPERLFDRVLGSEVMRNTLNRLVRGENGAAVSDPLGCFGSLSDETKNELKERLDKYGIDKPGESETIEAIQYFFGIA